MITLSPLSGLAPDFETVFVPGAAELAGGLGGVREDIVNTLAVVMGRAKAQKAFDDFEKLIREQAAAGAEARVKPMIIGALALGGVALAAAGVAVFLSLRR